MAVALSRIAVARVETVVQNRLDLAAPPTVNICKWKGLALFFHLRILEFNGRTLPKDINKDFEASRLFVDAFD